MKKSLFHYGRNARVIHPNILPSILKEGLNSTPVKDVKIFGNYNNIKDIYTEETLTNIKNVAIKYFDGYLGNSRFELDTIHKNNIEESRKRIINKEPYINVNKRVEEIKYKPLNDNFLKPFVITTGQSGKRNFTINGLNSMKDFPDFSGAYMSDMEDSTVYNLFLSVNGIRNDRDALNGSIRVDRGGVIKSITAKSLLIKRIPAIERNSFVYVNHKDLDIVVPASIVEMILYYEHCGKLAKEIQECIPFYLPKLRHKEDHATMVAWQTEIANIYNLDYETINTILIEDPGLVEDLYDVYANEKTAVCNAALWDYQRRITENMTIPSSMFNTYNLSECSKKKIINLTQMSDRHHMASDDCIISYKHLISNIAFNSGKLSEGGMDTRIPSKDIDERNKQTIDIEKGKKIEAIHFGNIRAWSGHPLITPIVAKPFIEKKNNNYPYFEDIIGDNIKLLQNLDNYLPSYEIDDKKLSTLNKSRPLPTLTGIRNSCKVSMFYLAAQLSVKQEGCIGLSGLFKDTSSFEDYATTGHSNKLIWQAITYKTKLQPCNTVLTTKNINEFVDKIKSECLEEKESRNLNYISCDDLTRASNIIKIVVTRDNYTETSKCLMDMYHAIEGRYERNSKCYLKEIEKADKFIDKLMNNRLNRLELENLSFDPDLADVINN